ncbi:MULTISPECIES: FkbM family methyltransferase [unclassified Mucilaginibacter]|uniref:FkbM family methyltransferase n=1 Tax=unclassified Mucilaginibacter TaxID=2617802 RepID=UPI0031F6EDE7
MIPDHPDFRPLHSYSQDGEDMLLRPLLMEHIKDYDTYKGFFVDIGAHHPFRYSNTMHFYEQGWRGINIEPTPAAIELFNQYREHDINLNVGIGAERTRQTLYCFNDSAFNSFDQVGSQSRHADTSPYHIVETAEVEIYPLAQVLEENLPAGQVVIDFMSVDVAGLDISVLRSNNWEKYRPSFVLVEDVDVNFSHLDASEAYSFLAEQGYQMVSKTPRTLIFKQTLSR